jgi:hypothetical protein
MRRLDNGTTWIALLEMTLLHTSYRLVLPSDIFVDPFAQNTDMFQRRCEAPVLLHAVHNGPVAGVVLHAISLNRHLFEAGAQSAKERPS